MLRPVRGDDPLPRYQRVVVPLCDVLRYVHGDGAGVDHVGV